MKRSAPRGKRPQKKQRAAAAEVLPQTVPPRPARPGPDALLSVFRMPAVSYLGIFLLQLKVIWGVWSYKDLTGGDTASYFLAASGWVTKGRASFLWSPLYTSFYSLMFHFSDDAYVITLLHRAVIVFSLALLVLALMRRLLPAGIAWMAAAWWVVLPIDFNSLYEVHLFTVIPLLLGVLAALWWPGPRGRAISSALLVITGVLMRQEYLMAAALLVVLSVGWDLRQFMKKKIELRELAAAYLMPLAASAALILFYYAHSNTVDLAKEMREKNSFNVCQLFAFGYQQRHTDFLGNPWTDCRPLMTRVFGADDLTIVEALFHNPSAMLAHVWWNLQQAPAGLQIALFNFRWGGVNPDYTASFQSSVAWLPTLAVCGVLASGFLLLRREPAYRQILWTDGRAWGWIALACACVGACNAILAANPRPSTLFILAIAVRAATAFCFALILSCLPQLERAARVAAIVLVGAVCLLPSVYQWGPSPRLLLQAYRRLVPARQEFLKPGATLVSTEFGDELGEFVARCGCASVRFDRIREEASASGTSFGNVLNKDGATLFLADERTIGDPAIRDFVSSPGAYHWRVLSGQHSTAENWALFEKEQ
jgi:hypothetical protein